MRSTHSYDVPSVPRIKKPSAKTAVLIASGDSRESANAVCWPAQQALERDAAKAFASLGWKLKRAKIPDERRGVAKRAHEFIASQAQGRAVFEGIHLDAPLVVAEAVWQYSHHVLMGLCRHRGPILLLANWSGRWPGLVGVLNLRGSLTKAGVRYSMLWAEDFKHAKFRQELKKWLRSAAAKDERGGVIQHDLEHARPLHVRGLPERERELGEALAAELTRRPAIMGVFDEGCMGMYNAIVPDAPLHAAGVYKERLSQSALYAAMRQVPSKESAAVFAWLRGAGMKFHTGKNEATELTERQVLEQCAMYIAAVRLADHFGCDAIGIQYQQGLKDLCAASDLAEGLLNCSNRPPVVAMDGPRAGKVIRAGLPISHFNEVDECAGLDGIITQRVWSAMRLEPDNTLHDLRWGDEDRSGTTKEFVWVLEISGAVPPSHLIGGYKGATSERQPAMYFRLGGGTIKGVSKPGEVVWSRLYVEPDAKGRERLKMDLGRCKAIKLPMTETRRRWEATTSQWPIMHTVFYGVSRDQMMAKHQSNHIQVVYGPDAKTADRALAAKAAMATAMGIKVTLCGDSADGERLGKRLRSL